MPLSELGAYLQRHREERGWTLEEVEALSRIRRPYLEALEAGDWDNLPPSVYTRGLLRNYARALGLSAASVMRMYVKERPREGRPAEPQLISQPLVVAPRVNFEFLAAVVLLVVSALLVAWVVRTQIPQLGARGTATEPGAVAAGTVRATGTVTRATATIDRSAPTLGARRTSAPVTPEAALGPDGTPGTAAAATASAGATAPEGGTAAATLSTPGGTPGAPSPAATGRATSTPTTVPGGRLTLELRATAGDAWIEVYTDGALAWRALLREGESRRWSARDVIGLRTGNAGGTEATLNGEKTASLGGRGEVKQYEWRLLPNGDIEQRPIF